MLSLDSRCLVGFCAPAKLSFTSEAHPEALQKRDWMGGGGGEAKVAGLREVLRELTGCIDRTC